jgi:hypothetical protein
MDLPPIVRLNLDFYKAKLVAISGEVVFKFFYLKIY